MGNLNIAEKYIKKYDLILKKNATPRYKIKSFLLKSELFFQKNNYPQSLNMINKAYSLQIKFSKSLSLLDGNRVKMKLIQHKLKILLKMNQFKKINLLLQKVENMLKKTPDSYTLSRILLIRSEYYYKLHKLDLAIKTGIKCAKLSKKYNFYGRLLNVYSKLSKWYSELNNPQLSLKYLKAKNDIEKKKINSRIPADIMSIILSYEQSKTSNELGRLKKINLRATLLSLSLIMLIIAIFLLFIRKYKEKHRETFIHLQEKINSYKTKEIKKDMSSEKAKDIMRRIIEELTKNKLYLDSELTLDNLSEKMNINHYYLSQAISSSWNGNFIDLVNTYRVKEAKEILSNSKFSHMNIIDIGFKVGFNSKSTFNRVFKNKINITPKEYRQINLE
jgi:AraC-like DNA-binding protein